MFLCIDDIQLGISYPPISLRRCSVTRRAASTSAANTFDGLVFFEVLAGYSANARGVEIGFLGLNAAEAAELLIALLLPLGDQVPISVAVLQ